MGLVLPSLHDVGIGDGISAAKTARPGAQLSMRQTRRRAAEPGDPMAHADPRIDAI
jgi:hypothetical protein